MKFKTKEIDYSKMGLTFNPGYRVIVTFETAKNGYDFDKESVAELLQLGIPYEVEYIDVGQSSSRIKLKGIDRPFNSVNFMQIVNAD